MDVECPVFNGYPIDKDGTLDKDKGGGIVEHWKDGSFAYEICEHRRSVGRKADGICNGRMVNVYGSVWGASAFVR